AYVRKLTTGKGTLVESSLFSAGFDLQTEPLTVFMSTRPGAQVIDRSTHLASWYHHAPYGIYRVADAEMVVSANPLPKLAEALDSDELRAMGDIDRYKERDKVAEMFASVLEKRTYADVAAAFDRHGIWYGPVHDFDDVADDPQVAALRVFREEDVLGRKITLVNHPIRYDDQVPELRVKGLFVGEHTREILAEHGYTEAQIEDLIARKVVGVPPADGVPAPVEAAGPAI
ncbi:MAG: CoA transferase, partial [Betaproteobacteria bacterium]